MTPTAMPACVPEESLFDDGEGGGVTVVVAATPDAVPETSVGEIGLPVGRPEAPEERLELELTRGKAIKR